LAAEAAEAAGAQGKFWEMHDLLFRGQDALCKKHLLRYAEMLALDLRRFCWELKNRIYRDRVRQDFRSGVMNGVYSTPAVFINGVRYAGPLGLEALLDAVNRIGDPPKNRLLGRGTPPGPVETANLVPVTQGSVTRPLESSNNQSGGQPT
jgi:predicted DsbA family dithiol-disulfide isomerase